MENGLRLLSKVLRQVVSSRRFTSYTDLKDAFLESLRRLRIPYQPHEFDDAFSVVGSNVRLVHNLPAAVVVHGKTEPRPVSRAEARAFFERVTKLGRAKAMPAAAKSRIDIYAAPPRENWGEHDRY